MNSLTRAWLTHKHLRKFARVGRRCRFPVPRVNIHGHVEIGDYCRFRDNVTLRTCGEGRIILAARSGFSWNCYAEARSRIQVGAMSGIAENCVLNDTCYHFCGNELAWRDAPMESRPIVIGEGCFIGSGCHIGPGVTIGDGAVIAHHSIVTRDIPANEIWGGAPVRFMGHRHKNIPERVRRQVEELIRTQGIAEERYLE